MNASDILAILKAVDPRRKPLERLGAFLCRRKVAALESDASAARARAEELERQLCELKREHAAKDERLAVFERRADFHRRFRRVPVSSLHFVYIERRTDGDCAPPLIACPVCHERDKFGFVVAGAKTDIVGINLYQKRVHLRCLNEGCGFHVSTSPEAFRKAHQFAD